MAFKERHLVRSEIVINNNNNNIEQINIFKNLGCSISDQNKKDIKVKISEFHHTMGIVHRTLKPPKSKSTRDQKYVNTLVLPTLLLGHET